MAESAAEATLTGPCGAGADDGARSIFAKSSARKRAPKRGAVPAIPYER